LRWEHVNLPFATIRKTIEKTAHKRPEPQAFPLSSAAVDVLKAWWKQQRKPQSGLVFTSVVNSKRMSATAMQKPWASIRKLGGLPDDLVLYTLRHNFASQLVMAGTDLLTVSRLMAHSDIQTTIAHYAHLAPDHKRDAVEAFAQKAPARASTISNQAPLTSIR
jgi:integrase